MYKPKPSANGVCADKVMKSFVENGDSVTCIVNGEYSSPNYETIDGINVRRIKPRLSYRLKELSENTNSEKYAKALSIISIIINKIKSLMMVFFWPLISLGYTYRFYKRAKQEHEKEKFDIVVSIYTPIDALIGGYLLKKKYPNIKFVPYFLDSLSGGYGPKCFSTNMVIRNGQKWERKLLKNADLIIAMKSSEQHHIKYNKQNYFFEKMIFLDIPLVNKSKITLRGLNILDKSKINVVFIGSIPYPVRSPKYILEVLEKVDNDKLQIIFVGENNCPNIFEKSKSALNEKLTLYDRVPYNKAQEIMIEADILINLGNNNSSMVPSKIFEYMSMGKPIISTYCIDDEPSITYLKKYPLALLLDERNEDIFSEAKKIEVFIKENIDRQIPYNLVEDKFKLNTPKAFVKEVEKLFNLGGRNDQLFNK